MKIGRADDEGMEQVMKVYFLDGWNEADAGEDRRAASTDAACPRSSLPGYRLRLGVGRSLKRWVAAVENFAPM